MLSKRLLIGIIPLLIAFWFIYNSKRDFYNNNVDFYDEKINDFIYKIKETRGTKVYYGSGNNFFYLEAYRGVPLKEGDSIIKIDQDIKIYRKNSVNEDYQLIGTGEPIKQPSYFVFFFT